MCCGEEQKTERTGLYLIHDFEESDAVCAVSEEIVNVQRLRLVAEPHATPCRADAMRCDAMRSQPTALASAARKDTTHRNKPSHTASQQGGTHRIATSDHKRHRNRPAHTASTKERERVTETAVFQRRC